MYDILIIGSGLGGLLCGSILAKEGYRVCIVEKNKQLGGNLQTFSRNKQIFDTGVHYIGGLGQRQNLYQIFKYAGIMDKLRIEKMDESFDRILLENDPKEYVQSQGYKTFINNLVVDFPEEERAITQYCNRIKEVCSKFPLYHLTLEGADSSKDGVLSLSAMEVIESFTSNKKLQAVLAGNNLLYAGVSDKTPFHVHALILNSYIESSWKCVDGGSQIAKLLALEIRKHNGHIIRNCEVTRIVEANARISIETACGKTLQGNYVISNSNPAATMNLISSPLLKEGYRKRIAGLENTISSFSLHLVLKEKTVSYQNHNYYYHKEGQLWNMNDYTEDNWPLGYGLYFTRDRRAKNFAATVSILSPMWFKEVYQWQHTHNRVGKESDRGVSYEYFKKRKKDQLLTLVKERFPDIVENIQHSYVATPLTNRDYTGQADGSMYGVQKDFTNPLKTVISPRTKIPNLFLTGQNLNLHGILGTSLSAVLTCTLLLNDNTLVDKIRNA